MRKPSEVVLVLGGACTAASRARSCQQSQKVDQYISHQTLTKATNTTEEYNTVENYNSNSHLENLKLLNYFQYKYKGKMTEAQSRADEEDISEWQNKVKYN